MSSRLAKLAIDIKRLERTIPALMRKELPSVHFQKTEPSRLGDSFGIDGL